MNNALKRIIVLTLLGPARWLKSKIVCFFLRGDNVCCPVCNKRFLTFLPFGMLPAPMRPNALCPNCFALERTRLFWLYLNTVPGFFNSEKKILHVAPENSLFQKFIHVKKFNYHPIDRFEKGYTYPKGTINMDVTSLQFPSNYFDFILCSHVLEHVHDDFKALREFYRVLRTDGFAIIQVPIDNDREVTYEDFSITSNEGRTQAFGQFDHVRIYGKDYKQRLESAGFIVTQHDYTSNLSSQEIFRFGLSTHEPLYIVRK